MSDLLYIHRAEELKIGNEAFIESVTNEDFAVVFEDNCETGYFYALDLKEAYKIIDALHVYDVKNVKDKNLPAQLKILWTEDLTKSFLSINDFYHAVFDFKNRAGYSRNAFPENQSGWVTIKDRKLTDELINELSKENKNC
jgi:hypothetical protein